MQIEVREYLLSFVAESLSSRVLCKITEIKINRNLLFPLVVCGCEIWSLTFREERRLRVFEGRVLWRIFGPKRDEVTGQWLKLHTEELNDLYS